MDAVHGGFEMVDAVGIADTGVAFAAGAERIAGDDGDFFLLEQLLAEFGAAQPAAADIGEDIKRALGLKAGQAQVVEGLDDVTAAAVVFVAHLFDLIIAGAQRDNGGVLAGGGGRHDAALVNLGHDLDDRLRPGRVAQPPAGHGIRLAEAVDHDGTLGHAGQRGDADMAVEAIGQLGINFIRQHDHIGAAQHFGDGFQVFLFHDRAGRVVGVRQDQQLGARGDGRAQRFRR